MPLGKKILLTGGHAATTALALVEELIRRKGKNGWEIFWVGSRESQIFERVGVKTHFIFTGKLQRKLTFWTIPSLLKIPFGLFHALLLVSKIKPDIIVSFGGYAAFPIVVIAWLKRVPIIIHEQVATAGLANRLSQIFAKKICISREESRKFYPAKKTILTGNPIMTQITEIEPKKEIGKPPLIFVTSGSQGSVIVNDALLEILAQLLTKYKLIHLTGEYDFARFAGIKNKNYEVYSWVDPFKIDNIYCQADMVIARAGANTVSEIMATKRPAILIPIPWSYLNEQNKNAQIAQKFGIARILKQDGLTGKHLFSEIELLEKNWQKIVAEVYEKEVFDKKAAKRLVDVILE